MMPSAALPNYAPSVTRHFLSTCEGSLVLVGAQPSLEGLGDGTRKGEPYSARGPPVDQGCSGGRREGGARGGREGRPGEGSGRRPPTCPAGRGEDGAVRWSTWWEAREAAVQARVGHVGLESAAEPETVPQGQWDEMGDFR